MPVARLDYTQCENDRANIAYAKNKLHEILHAAEAQDILTIDRYAHLVGGCAMSDKPETGVIDSDHRAWGIPNLFVCDGSVMPTQGLSQPRAHDHGARIRLAERLGASGSTPPAHDPSRVAHEPPDPHRVCTWPRTGTAVVCRPHRVAVGQPMELMAQRQIEWAPPRSTARSPCSWPARPQVMEGAFRERARTAGHAAQRLGRGQPHQKGDQGLRRPAGHEAELRHFLESAVLQANTDTAPDAPQPHDEEDEEPDADEQMAQTFRSFAAEHQHR